MIRSLGHQVLTSLLHQVEALAAPTENPTAIGNGLPEGGFQITSRHPWALLSTAPVRAQIHRGTSAVELSALAALSQMLGVPLTTAMVGQLVGNRPIIPIPEKGKAPEKQYVSTLPGVEAEQAFQTFVNELHAALASVDLRFITDNDSGKITNGTRAFFEESGFPPVLAPVEITIDPAKREVRFVCLDGHVFAGENIFTFHQDGDATKIVQDSIFEGSSPLALVGLLTGAFSRQTEIWRGLHDFLYQQLVSNP